MLSILFSSPFINMVCIQSEKMNKKPKFHFNKNTDNTILAKDQLDTLFHVFIYFVSLHVLGITCSSSGEQIVLIHHLVWLVCVSDCLVCLTGIPSSHLHRLIIPDDVLTQFDLLMMSTVMLETCREMKWINTWKIASSWLLARISSSSFTVW